MAEVAGQKPINGFLGYTESSAKVGHHQFILTLTHSVVGSGLQLTALAMVIVWQKHFS